MSVKLFYIIVGAVFSVGAVSADLPGGVYNFVFDPIERSVYYPQTQAIAPVVKLEKKVNESFKKGELLLQTDPSRLEAFVMKWHAELKKSLTELNTRERLFNDGNGSYFDFINAKAAVDDARANLEIAMINLEATSIFAPYDGKVAALMIEKGALPVETIAMMELVNDQTLIAKILLPSQLANSVKVGDHVTLTVFETGDQIQAQINRIGAVIDPMSSTIKMDAEIDNKGQKWKSGMHGTASFGQKSMFIPDPQKSAPAEEEKTSDLNATFGVSGEPIVLHSEYYGEFSGSIAFSKPNVSHSEETEIE